MLNCRNFVVLVFANCLFGYTVRDAPLLTRRPHWLKACKRSDPNVNSCLTDMFLGMFPYLATGIPEINVEKFEPLLLEGVSISKGNGPIILTGRLFDMTIAGPSNSTPKNTEFIYDKEHGHWNFGLDMPLLDIKSQYNLKGHILVLPLVGHGNCDLKLFNIRTKVSTNASFPLKDGREIISIDDMKVRFEVGGMKVKLDNLFNGNKVLGHTVNTFINNNGLEIITELEDSLGESLASIFKRLFNNIFVKIPIDLWYLTDEQYEEYEKEAKELDS